MEEWRDIKGYEGLYQVSNLGRVKSLGNSKSKKEKILKSIKDNKGYLIVNLYKNGKVKHFKVHRLVAIHLIENPNNYTQVNHKDENKSNNRVDNLEWCTAKYNLNYGTRNKRASEKLKGKNKGIEFTEEHKKNLSTSHKGSKHSKARKVQCITTGKKFNCITEGIEYYYLNYDTKSSITMCCKGKRKSAGKHPVTGEKLKWRYIDNK